jgi:hypothetical protein
MNAGVSASSPLVFRHCVRAVYKCNLSTNQCLFWTERKKEREKERKRERYKEKERDRKREREKKNNTYTFDVFSLIVLHLITKHGKILHQYRHL